VKIEKGGAYVRFISDRHRMFVSGMKTAWVWPPGHYNIQYRL
jgi:hypothetical protein